MDGARPGASGRAAEMPADMPLDTPNVRALLSKYGPAQTPKATAAAAGDGRPPAAAASAGTSTTAATTAAAAATTTTTTTGRRRADSAASTTSAPVIRETAPAADTGASTGRAATTEDPELASTRGLVKSTMSVWASMKRDASPTKAPVEADPDLVTTRGAVRSALGVLPVASGAGVVIKRGASGSSLVPATPAASAPDGSSEASVPAGSKLARGSAEPTAAAAKGASPLLPRAVVEAPVDAAPSAAAQGKSTSAQRFVSAPSSSSFRTSSATLQTPAVPAPAAGAATSAGVRIKVGPTQGGNLTTAAATPALAPAAAMPAPAAASAAAVTAAVVIETQPAAADAGKPVVDDPELANVRGMVRSVLKSFPNATVTTSSSRRLSTELSTVRSAATGSVATAATTTTTMGTAPSVTAASTKSASTEPTAKEPVLKTVTATGAKQATTDSAAKEPVLKTTEVAPPPASAAGAVTAAAPTRRSVRDETAAVSSSTSGSSTFALPVLRSVGSKQGEPVLTKTPSTSDTSSFALPVLRSVATAAKAEIASAAKAEMARATSDVSNDTSTTATPPTSSAGTVPAASLAESKLEASGKSQAGATTAVDGKRGQTSAESKRATSASTADAKQPSMTARATATTTTTTTTTALAASTAAAAATEVKPTPTSVSTARPASTAGPIDSKPVAGALDAKPTAVAAPAATTPPDVKAAAPSRELPAKLSEDPELASTRGKLSAAMSVFGQLEQMTAPSNRAPVYGSVYGRGSGAPGAWRTTASSSAGSTTTAATTARPGPAASRASLDTSPQRRSWAAAAASSTARLSSDPSATDRFVDDLADGLAAAAADGTAKVAASSGNSTATGSPSSPTVDTVPAVGASGLQRVPSSGRNRSLPSSPLTRSYSQRSWLPVAVTVEDAANTSDQGGNAASTAGDVSAAISSELADADPQQPLQRRAAVSVRIVGPTPRKVGPTPRLAIPPSASSPLSKSPAPGSPSNSRGGAAYRNSDDDLAASAVGDDTNGGAADGAAGPRKRTHMVADLMAAPRGVSRASSGSTPAQTPGILEDRSWARFAGADVANGLDKVERTRQEAIWELILTEEDFFVDMAQVIKSFMIPLEEFLGESDVRRIFSNLDDVCLLSHSFMGDLQIVQQEQGPIVNLIGPLLVKRMDDFKTYAPYCSNLPRASSFLQTKRKEPDFNEVYKSCVASFNSALDLDSFLLKPMQRVTKMPLLLRGILKCTPPEHPDYEPLKAAFAIVDEVVTYINNECGNAAQRNRLDGIHQQLLADVGDDVGKSLLDPAARTLVRATSVLRVNPDAKLLACLFTDIVLFVREERDFKSGRNYRYYLRPIPLSLLDWRSMEEKRSAFKKMTEVRPTSAALSTERHTQVIFTDYGASITLDIRYQSPSDCGIWLQELDEVRQELPDPIVAVRPILLGNMLGKVGLNDASSEILAVTGSAGYYLLGTGAGLYSWAERTNTVAQIKQTAKRVTSVAADETANLVVVNEGKSGWLRLYRYRDLVASAVSGAVSNEDPLKVPWSKGTSVFRLGRSGKDVLLASAGARLVLARYDNDAREFLRLCDVPIPGSVCNSLDYCHHELWVATPAGFFTLPASISLTVSYNPTPIIDAASLPSSSPLAATTQATKAALPLPNGGVLLCFEDFGVVLTAAHLQTRPVAPKTVWSWIHPARSFAMVDGHLLVLCDNHIEVYAVPAMNLVQTVRAPGVRFLHTSGRAVFVTILVNGTATFCEVVQP